MPATPLSDPPADGISSLTFSPTRPDVLLCSSWDGTVRCYDLGGSSALVASAPQPSACLAATFCGDDATAVVGGVDGSVRVARVDGLGGAYGGSALGAHEAGVRCLSYGSRANAAYSGSWDRTIACWDPRSGGRVASAPVPGKVFAMDLADHGGQPRLVVGTSDRHVLVFDARSLDQPLQERESPLKHQTRCLACFPDDRGFAVSSIEGRVAIEYFAEADQAAKRARSADVKADTRRGEAPARVERKASSARVERKASSTHVGRMPRVEESHRSSRTSCHELARASTRGAGTPSSATAWARSCIPSTPSRSTPSLAPLRPGARTAR